tara:strand:- start:1396 stop:2805 length:1410 start_codon:yes stop_codon:yes gene_type:complete
MWSKDYSTPSSPLSRSLTSPKREEDVVQEVIENDMPRNVLAKAMSDSSDDQERNRDQQSQKDSEMKPERDGPTEELEGIEEVDFEVIEELDTMDCTPLDVDLKGGESRGTQRLAPADYYASVGAVRGRRKFSRGHSSRELSSKSESKFFQSFEDALKRKVKKTLPPLSDINSRFSRPDSANEIVEEEGEERLPEVAGASSAIPETTTSTALCNEETQSIPLSNGQIGKSNMGNLVGSGNVSSDSSSFRSEQRRTSLTTSGEGVMIGGRNGHNSAYLSLNRSHLSGDERTFSSPTPSRPTGEKRSFQNTVQRGYYRDSQSHLTGRSWHPSTHKVFSLQTEKQVVVLDSDDDDANRSPKQKEDRLTGADESDDDDVMTEEERSRVESELEFQQQKTSIITHNGSVHEGEGTASALEEDESDQKKLFDVDSEETEESTPPKRGESQSAYYRRMEEQLKRRKTNRKKVVGQLS